MKQPQSDKLEVNDGGPDRELIINLINLYSLALSPLRRVELAPKFESLAMTAAVTFAGCLHGEMQGLFGVEEISDEDLAKMAVNNFRAGQEAGKAKVDRLRPNQNAVFDMLQQILEGVGDAPEGLVFEEIDPKGQTKH